MGTTTPTVYKKVTPERYQVYFRLMYLERTSSTDYIDSLHHKLRLIRGKDSTSDTTSGWIKKVSSIPNENKLAGTISWI